MLRKVTSTAARSAFRSNVGVVPFVASPAVARREYSSKRRNFAIVATGVGFLDGTDVTEASSLMIHLGEVGFTPVFFAPEGNSEETIDHATRDVDKNEIRDIHAEVTRLSRSKVVPLKTLRVRLYFLFQSFLFFYYLFLLVTTMRTMNMCGLLTFY